MKHIMDTDVGKIDHCVIPFALKLAAELCTPLAALYNWK